MVWLVFAVLTACVSLVVTRPLRRTVAPAGNTLSEIEAYKLQFHELCRDEERGTLSKEEAEQTRTEISRRLLKAGRQSHSVPAGTSTVSANTIFIALASVIALGAAGLYAEFGSPGLPDQPLEARLNAPIEKQPLDIQIANVEHRLRVNPNDALGWSVIAPVYFRIGQFEKAANAYRKAIQLSGEDENKLLGLAEALTFANNGTIPDEAKPVLDAAIAQNPKSLRGRFWLAIRNEQEGNKSGAEQVYREMLGENPPQGWKTVINERIAALNSGPAGTAGGALNAQGSNAVAQGGQGAMIRGMVSRLAARLNENSADLDGWLRLIRSYAVLNETEKAQEAAATARKQFASDSLALEQIDGLAREVGLEAANGSGVTPTLNSGATPTEASGEKGSSAETESHQGGPVRGMVDRLAARLKENAADLNGWLMLIRSYAVLNENEKAREAAATARKQFASDNHALEQIEALAREVGLEAPIGTAEKSTLNGGPAPREASGEQGSNAVAQGDQGAMIRGMVDRLAARLKENAADLDGWLQLIRSYAVLNENEKAQEATATARKQFASDNQALAQIEALAREVGLETPNAEGGRPKS